MPQSNTGPTETVEDQLFLFILDALNRNPARSVETHVATNKGKLPSQIGERIDALEKSIKGFEAELENNEDKPAAWTTRIAQNLPRFRELMADHNLDLNQNRREAELHREFRIAAEAYIQSAYIQPDANTVEEHAKSLLERSLRRLSISMTNLKHRDSSHQAGIAAVDQTLEAMSQTPQVDKELKLELEMYRIMHSATMTLARRVQDESECVALAETFCQQLRKDVEAELSKKRSETTEPSSWLIGVLLFGAAMLLAGICLAVT